MRERNQGAWGRDGRPPKPSARRAARATNASLRGRPEPIELDPAAGGEMRVVRDFHHAPAACLEVSAHAPRIHIRAGAVARQHDHGMGDLVAVAVRDQPVQGLAGAAGAVDSWGADHHEAVGESERALHRRVHEPGAGVGDHEVVEAGEHAADPLVPGAVERIAHRRVLFGREYLQSPGQAGVAGHVAQRARRLQVLEHVPHGDRRVAGEAVGERARVRVGVQRDHPVAAVLREHEPEARRDRGLADAALDRAHRDLVRARARQRATDAAQPVPAGPLGRAEPRVHQPAGEPVQHPAPAALGTLAAETDDRVLGELPELAHVTNRSAISAASS